MDRKKRDKKRERWYVERFLKSLLPDVGYTLLNWERPDFLLVSGDRRIGIEHTALYWEPQGGSPRQEQEGLQRRICEKAKALWDDAERPHVEVDMHFTGMRLRKDAVGHVAARLVALVEEHLPPDGAQTRIESPWPQPPSWPQCIDSLWISRLVPYARTHWHTSDADCIPPLTVAYLQSRIDEKNDLLAGYATDVAEHWLLMTTDVTRLSTYFCVGSEVTDAEYETLFARLFLFEPDGPNLTEFKKKAGAS